MKRKGKISTTVYLTHDQREKLDRLSRATDVPQSVIIRRGVDLAIDWYEGREELIEKGLREP